MDYDGYERRPPQVPKPLSPEDEQRIVAERQYVEMVRLKWEQHHLAFLESSPTFAAMVAAQDIYNEHDKHAIAAAVAEEMAKKYTTTNIDVKQLAEVVRDTIENFSHQQNKEQIQQQEASPAQQSNPSIEPPIPSRPGPIDQRSGKYAELGELSQQATYDDPGEEIPRRQREESDRRQDLTPDAQSQRRETTEQEHREASIEQTERRQARNPEAEALMERRRQLMELYGRAGSEATKEREQDGGIER